MGCVPVPVFTQNVRTSQNSAPLARLSENVRTCPGPVYPGRLQGMHWGSNPLPHEQSREFSSPAETHLLYRKTIRSTDDIIASQFKLYIYGQLLHSKICTHQHSETSGINRLASKAARQRRLLVSGGPGGTGDTWRHRPLVAGRQRLAGAAARRHEPLSGGGRLEPAAAWRRQPLDAGNRLVPAAALKRLLFCGSATAWRKGSAWGAIRA